jgi:hypothetical protein
VNRFAITAVLVLAFAVAGCGGEGSKTLSKEEYASRLRQICASANAEQKRIGTPTSISEFSAKAPKLLDVFDKAVAKVEKLKPPDELKSTAGRFVSQLKQIRRLIDQVLAAAKKNDAAKVLQLGAQAQSLSNAADAAARKLGAPACVSG